MAQTSTTSISVAVTGDGTAETYTPPTAPITNSPSPAGGPLKVALASGDNPITVPPGAVGLFFVPPSSSTVAKKLKGVGGDTGWQLNMTLPQVLTIPPGTATVLINAASAETVVIHWL